MTKIPWIVGLALTTGWLNAQDVPPLPPMRGEGASLIDTMKFIQDKLPGKVNYMVYAHDNVAGTDGVPTSRSYTLTAIPDRNGVIADAGRCSIGVHVEFNNGQTVSGTNLVIFLKQVSEVVLAQMDQVSQQANARGGHPEMSVKVDPPVALVQVRYAGGEQNWVEVAGKRVMVFNFYDETMAERVSKALQHAVELCGGGKLEPF